MRILSAMKKEDGTLEVNRVNVGRDGISRRCDVIHPLGKDPQTRMLPQGHQKLGGKLSGVSGPRHR
jgi:hypothetical protein